MSQSKEKAALIVTREELADMLLISPHEVNSLWKSHRMPKEARGQYDLAKVIPFIIRRKNAQIAAAKHGDLTKAEADRQLVIVNMELAKIELAEKRRVTVNVDDAEKEIAATITASAKKLDTLVRNLRSTFPKDEPSEVRVAREEKLEGMVEEVRNDMAQIPEKLFGARPTKKSKKKGVRRGK